MSSNPNSNPRNPLSTADTIPLDRKGWVIKYRVGQVENVYGDFECDVSDCECQFSNLADFLLHWCYGKHGRLGDRDAEQKRMTNKYYSRQGRLKHDLYRQEAAEEAESEQSQL